MFRIILVISLLVCFDTFGQELRARIMFTRGENILLNSGRKLRTGQELRANDSIYISNNGYIGLILPDGQSFEMKDEGNHHMAGYLHKALKDKPNPCLEIWAEKEFPDPIQGGTGIVNHCSSDYQLVLIGGKASVMDIYPSMIRMTFNAPVLLDSLVVSFYNICDEKVHSITSTQAFVEHDLSSLDLRMVHHDAIIMRANGYHNETVYHSELHALKLTDAERTAKVRSDLLALSTHEELLEYFVQNNFVLNANFERARE